MHTHKLSLLGLSLICVTSLAHAQGNFQNLNFESASLTPIPAGQYGGFVAIGDALPGWTGYLGTSQMTQVLQNNFTLGSASIDIISPDWNGYTMEGNYYVVLQAGSLGTDIVPAAIAQTGLIPGTSRSIQFKTSPAAGSSDLFQVTLGGQNISLVQLLNTSNYILYGGDISAFAGQAQELKIAALPGFSG